jgi:hypothetical protein
MPLLCFDENICYKNILKRHKMYQSWYRFLCLFSLTRIPTERCTPCPTIHLITYDLLFTASTKPRHFTNERLCLTSPKHWYKELMW